MEELHPLTRARVRRGWTKSELARRSGVSAKTIEAIESRAYEVRLDTLGRLAQALGLDFEELMEPAEETG